MNPRPNRLCKTPKAWSRLAQPTPLSRLVRAVLLLTNGQRSEQELSILLGTDVSSVVHDLWLQGYLQTAAQNLFDDEWEDIGEDWTARTRAHTPPVELRASA